MPIIIRNNSINRTKNDGRIRSSSVNRQHEFSLVRNSGVLRESWRRELDVKGLPYSTDYRNGGSAGSGSRYFDLPDSMIVSSSLNYQSGYRWDEAVAFFGSVDVSKFSQLTFNANYDASWDSIADNGEALIQFGVCQGNSLSNMTVNASRTLRGWGSGTNETISLPSLTGNRYVFVRLYTEIDMFNPDAYVTAYAQVDSINSLKLH